MSRKPAGQYLSAIRNLSRMSSQDFSSLSTFADWYWTEQYGAIMLTEQAARAFKTQYTVPTCEIKNEADIYEYAQDLRCKSWAANEVIEAFIAFAKGVDMANDEWFTPPEVLNGVRSVLGQIDLDPASCAEADSMVMANHYICLPHSGLDVDWDDYMTVFVNPPFSDMSPWVDKAVACSSPVFMIANNSTETRWGQKLLKAADVVHFPNKRVQFIGPGGRREGGNRYAQMFVLLHASKNAADKMKSAFPNGVTLAMR